MKRSAVFGGVILALVAAFTLGTVAVPKETVPTAGLFAPLKKGQRVRLREKAGSYEISVMPGAALGQKIVEVGPDYLVLEDATGLTQTRIPVYALRAVTISRVAKGR